MRVSPALTAACVGLVSFSSAAFAQFGASQAPPPAPADLVLTHGQIYTPSGFVDSIAVSKGVIVAIGDASAVKPYTTSATKTVDLKGQTVLPGLHDMHVHPGGAGMSELFQCKLPHGSSPEQIFAIVAKCVQAHKPGEWITGRAYEAASFGATPPNKSMLDKVAPNNPVLLNDISGHSAWANSLALKIAGITKDTKNPPNGIIERDPNGEPTGLLREAPAVGIVSQHVPPPSQADTEKALKWALDTMLAQGVTAFDDALVTQDLAQAYADLSDRGELKQRVRGCLIYLDSGLIARRGIYARDRFSPSCVKIILDGVPTDSHTAAMLEDYLPAPGRNDKGRERGLLMQDTNDLKILVTHYELDGPYS